MSTVHTDFSTYSTWLFAFLLPLFFFPNESTVLCVFGRLFVYPSRLLSARSQKHWVTLQIVDLDPLKSRFQVNQTNQTNWSSWVEHLLEHLHQWGSTSTPEPAFLFATNDLTTSFPQQLPFITDHSPFDLYLHCTIVHQVSPGVRLLQYIPCHWLFVVFIGTVTSKTTSSPSLLVASPA